jgi:hypothetical protein
MRDVRANTEINHWSAAIYGCGSTIRYFLLDEIFFIFVILKNIRFFPTGSSEHPLQTS